MAFLGDSEIKDAIKRGEEWIHPFEPKHLKSAAYELGLGGEAFVTDAKDGKPEMLGSNNPTVEINPGQFALLITSETVNIPRDKLAFISIKAGIKFRGLVNVSGFHVDPGFTGKLLFSVYNAGSAKITLRNEERYFLIWFSELKSQLNINDAYNDKENHHQGQKEISTEYIDKLKSGEVASPSQLLSRIKETKSGLQTDINALKGELNLIAKDLSGKKENIKWLLTTVVTLLVAIGTQVFFNNKYLDQYDKYYERGLKERDVQAQIKETISNLKSPQVMDSIYVISGDSVKIYKVNSR